MIAISIQGILHIMLSKPCLPHLIVDQPHTDHLMSDQPYVKYVFNAYIRSTERRVKWSINPVVLRNFAMEINEIPSLCLATYSCNKTHRQRQI